MPRQWSKREILMRVLRCSNQTAKEILNGDREMNDHQIDLVNEYNRTTSAPEYRLVIPELIEDVDGGEML